jgi:hypothetical protein
MAGAAGGWSWEPDPALREALRKLAASYQRAVQPGLDSFATQRRITQRWLDAMAPLQSKWAETARQSAGLRETIERTSQMARSVRALQPQLEAWSQHNKQIADQVAQTVRMMQAGPSLRAGFSEQTLARASGLLDEIRDLPPEAPADMETAVLEIPDAVREVPDAVVHEAIDAAEPAVSGVDPAKARRIVVTVVATFVFLKVIQWAIEHPDAADQLLTMATLAWWLATAAGNQAGALCDRILAARSTDHDAHSDPDDD